MHWAHRVASRFPDGQLYVDLRGFASAGSPVDPAVVVREFLDAFGVPSQRIPATSEGQVALYRSLLSGRRVLVVLDNARNAAHVRPLLPGAPGCRTVVTSRDQLTGLVAAQGAGPLVLDVLSPAESRYLLERRLGVDRVAADPVAVDEIIARCAGLPLALAIVAARADIRPEVPFASLAARLREAHTHLDAFAGSDAATNMRAVFYWSYRILGEPAARMFRLLGLHPGPDVNLAAAASLLGETPRQARVLLAKLAEAHLVTERGDVRWTIHDLLRVYAAELVNIEDTSDDRATVVRRVLDHYLHTAHPAARILYRNQAARTWFAAEYPVLLAAVRHAAANGLDTHACHLAGTMVGFLDGRGLWRELVATTLVGLDAARRSANRLAQAQAHHDLAGAYARLDLLDDASFHIDHAFELFRGIDDRLGLARVHLRLAALRYQQGNHEESFQHDQQALDLYRAIGDRAGQGRAMNNMGWMHALLGRRQQALECCQQALALYQETDDRAGEANAWDSLGFAHHNLAQYDAAIACHRRALAGSNEHDDPYLEADIHNHLGDSYRAAGNINAARETWRQALTIMDSLNHPDTDQVRDKLNRLTPDP